MFRRPGKNPLDDYKEEAPQTLYKYGAAKGDLTESPPRLFETPHQSIATPMKTQESNWTEEKTSSLPHHFRGSMKEENPETTLGEGVTFRGDLTFERLLRIDGTFEGKLLSQGKVIIGPKGKVKADLNLREAIIEGALEGNITVQEKLELRGEASVRGDIKAKSLSVDDGVEIIGVVQVTSKEEGITY